MNYQKNKEKRLLKGQRVKCIDDSFQHGLILNELYTVRENEKKNKKNEDRKISLVEIKGKWDRARFLLI